MRPELADAVTAYVALGANLGDAASAVQEAMQALDRLPLTRVTRRSSLYKTVPITSDGASAAQSAGADYINAVVELETELAAPVLLRQLQQLEQAAGRERPYRDAPRTLDLDLLLYGSARIESQELTVPHPRMAQRAFVLVPLSEIAPALVPQVQLDAVAGQGIERLEAGAP